jgi:hypothetical protein
MRNFAARLILAAGCCALALFSAPQGVKFADGSTRPSYDLILHPAKARARL